MELFALFSVLQGFTVEISSVDSENMERRFDVWKLNSSIC